jgi:hypothetical protein
MATFVTDLIGKSGSYVTHGAGSIVRRCKVIGYVPSGESAYEKIIAFAVREATCKGRTVWKDVTDRSGAHRYLIVTPQLTASGEISKTGNRIIMSPNKYSFEIYFTPDDSPGILESLSTRHEIVNLNRGSLMVTIAEIKEALSGMQFQYGPASYKDMRDEEFEAEMDRMYDGLSPLILVSVLEALTREYMTYEDGSIDHLSMSAGECAVEVLEGLGLVDDEFGDGGKWIDPRPSSQEILSKITE